MDVELSNQQQFLNPLYKAELSGKDFDRLSKFIITEFGIKMPPDKKIMLQSRLQKRLKELNMNNFKEYVDYVFSPKGQSEEVIHMMDLVSTNKTDFFRESAHFDYLLSDALPKLMSQLTNRTYTIWSAGCSSGEEPYTLAITLSEFIEKHSGYNFLITCSDLSNRMLQKAVNGVYHEDRVSEIPLSIKKKYFLRSKNHEEKTVKVINQLRSKLSFYRQNLLYLPQVNKAEFDIIFCRNVLIYFDRATQYTILQKLCMQLKTGGYLFLGHSESITGFDLPIEQLKPTVFKKI